MHLPLEDRPLDLKVSHSMHFKPADVGCSSARCENDPMPIAWSPTGTNRVIAGDNLEVVAQLPDGAFTSSTWIRRSTPGAARRGAPARERPDPPPVGDRIQGAALRAHPRRPDAATTTSSRTTGASSSRGWPRPGGCSPTTERSTCTSTTARRTTPRCCSTRCSAGSASSTRSSGPTTTAPSRRAAGRPSTTRSWST